MYYFVWLTVYVSAQDYISAGKMNEFHGGGFRALFDQRTKSPTFTAVFVLIPKILHSVYNPSFTLI
jgi:hypothetical protein